MKRSSSSQVTSSPLPRWLPPVNRLMKWLQRRGISIDTMRVLAVPGRTTGEMRATPVSPMELGDDRYIVAGFAGSDWVRNARASGWATLSRGRHTETVDLVEVPTEETGPILREFPRLVPHGVSFFRNLHGAVTSEDFAALAGRCPVFRVAPRN